MATRGMTTMTTAGTRPGFGDAPDRLRLRECLGRFATGVAVVTYDGFGGRRGLTINSFTSVSMEPPLVLVSVARRASAHDELSGRAFSVNLLGAEQEALGRHFAGGHRVPLPVGAVPFEPRFVESVHAPRLAGCLAVFECTPWRDYPAGDHTLFLGLVADFDYRPGDALGFVNSSFTTIPHAVLGHEYLM